MVMAQNDGKVGALMVSRSQENNLKSRMIGKQLEEVKSFKRTCLGAIIPYAWICCEYI